MISDQYDRGDADTPRRLRRENVESSPPVAVPGSVPPGGVARGGCGSMVGTDRKAGHVSLLWESVIAHLGLSVRPRWLPDTRDDHDLCGGSSGLIAALTASASSRLTGTSIVIRTTILSPLMAPSVSADPHQSDPVEMGWQSCGDLALNRPCPCNGIRAYCGGN